MFRLFHIRSAFSTSSFATVRTSSSFFLAEAVLVLLADSCFFSANERSFFRHSPLSACAAFKWSSICCLLSIAWLKVTEITALMLSTSSTSSIWSRMPSHVGLGIASQSRHQLLQSKTSNKKYITEFCSSYINWFNMWLVLLIFDTVLQLNVAQYKIIGEKSFWPFSRQDTNGLALGASHLSGWTTVDHFL